MSLSGTPVGAIEWIEANRDGRVVRADRQGRWRPQWMIDLEKNDGGVEKLVLRAPRDPDQVAGSHLLSHYSIRYEADILEKLQGSGVLVPEFFGFFEPAQCILMERVDGVADFGVIDDETERRNVADDYFRNLARLHALDVDDLGLTKPDTLDGRAIALNSKCRLMELDYLDARPRLNHREPLLEFGRWWVHNNVPPAPERLSLIQSDTGPGQFLHAAGRVTALIDWELAHVADPMLDLGQMRMRNMLYPMGDLNEYFDSYEDERGVQLNREAVLFYTVMSMLLTPLILADSIHHPSASVPSMMPRFGWDVTLRKGLCQALAEAMGITLDRPKLPDEASNRSGWMSQLLVEQLRDICLPLVDNDYLRYEVRSALATAEAIRRSEAIGPELLAADLADIAQLTGKHRLSREEAFADAADLVEQDAAAIGEELIRAFHRIESRREHLWRPLMVAQQSVDLLPLRQRTSSSPS